MSNTIQCACGKMLKINDELRGKKMKCTACGNVLQVEPKTAAQATPRSGGEDAPASSGPIKHPSAKSNNMLFLVSGRFVVLAVLTCCVGVGGGIWFFQSEVEADKSRVLEAKTPGGAEEEKADLVYIPEDVAWFVSMRVADGWKSPAVQHQLKLDDHWMGAVGTLDHFGLKPEVVERLSFFIDSVDVPAKKTSMVLRTTKAMNPRKMVEAMVKNENDFRRKFNQGDGGRKELKTETKEVALKQTKHEGAVIWKFGETVLTFPSDYILLAAPNEAILKVLLKQLKNPAKRASTTLGLQMASSGKYPFVMAFDRPTDDARFNLAWFFSPVEQVEQVATTMNDMTGGVLAFTVTKDVDFEAVVMFPSNEKATRAKKVVEDLVITAKGLIKKRGFPIPKVVDSILAEQRGLEIVVTARGDPKVDSFRSFAFGKIVPR